jgi:hypothetical protein
VTELRNVARVGLWLSISVLAAMTGRGARASCAVPLTYYVSPTGLDASPGLTASTPWKTFSKAWSVLTPCDTLILLDGTYLQDLSPPSSKNGTATGPIVIKADNDGAAIIDGEGKRDTLDLSGHSYLVFEGLKIHNALDPVVSLSGGHHNTLRRVALKSTRPSDDSWNGECGVCLSNGAHDNLFEEAWIWGRGRYKVMMYGDDGASNPPYANTFRRVVIRYDNETDRDGEPQGAISFYSAHDNVAENLIVIDGEMGPVSKIVSAGSVYITGHQQNSSGNKFLGSLILNNKAEGIYVDCDQNSSCQNTVIENTVLWDNTGAGISVYHANPSKATGTVVKHVTSGANGDDGIGNWSSKGYFTNNLLVSNAGAGYSGGETTNFTFDYNNISGNSQGNYKNQSAGAHDIHVDPQLKYITRLESGAPGDNAGDDGKDMGANVEKRYQGGALTAADLWPWPNEARIRADMCNGVSSGWCATTKSLTEYVWGYLGNSWPPSNDPPDPNPPAAPTGVERTDVK